MLKYLDKGVPVFEYGTSIRKECRDAFPVGVASPRISAAYDVAMASGLTRRTSYVIAQDGRIVAVHADADYRGHVDKTLAAVRALRK